MLRIQRAAGPAGHTIVAASGQVDLATAPQLAEALKQAHAEGATTVVLDLAAVDFLDSAGVRVLVEAARQAERADATLSVRGAAGWVARVLEITGVHAYLNVSDQPPTAPGGPSA